MTDVAYDASATGSFLGDGSTVNTVSITAAAGADIILITKSSFTSDISTPEYDGNGLVQVGSSVTPANEGTIGYLSVFRGAGLGTGSSADVTFISPASTYILAVVVSATDVNGVELHTATGNSTTASSGSQTIDSGDLLIGAIGSGRAGRAATLSSPTGGTNRSLDSSSSTQSLSVSTSTVDSTSFGASVSSGNSYKEWCTATVVLKAPVVLTPSGIASAEAFGTPEVDGPQYVQPSSVPWSGGFGTPAVLGPQYVSVDSGISSSEAFGTALVSGGLVVVEPTGVPSAEAFGDTWVDVALRPTGIFEEAFGTAKVTRSQNLPLDNICADLNAGIDTSIQVLGDSTAWGAYDDGSSQLTNPWTPGTLRGWPGRLALYIAEYYDASVVVYTWNYPSDSSYDSGVTLRDAGGGRPTLTVWLGGWPGAKLSTYLIAIADMLTVSDPGLVIIQDGFNDLVSTTSTFVSNYQTLVSEIQTTYCPGAPILLTTENATPVTGHTGYASFSSLFNAMINAFIPGESLGMSPAVQKSTNTDDLWVIDTRQAGQTTDDLDPAGSLPYLHPNGSGYEMQAAFMLAQLTPDIIRLFAEGVASGEAFGTADVGRGPVYVDPSGAASAEAFGTAEVIRGPAYVYPSGITSGEAFGDIILISVVTGIPSAEAFGAATVARIEALPDTPTSRRIKVGGRSKRTVTVLR